MSTCTMNLADPQLELIDPTPNVHMLFIHFDQVFFWTKLSNRAVVRWSKRMYSCAGICSYEGRGGLCDIALSEPLLKLRPRKDLVETLLHEMIHAFLFVTNRDQDRDGHGPNFKAHMNRINKSAGLNISIYHDFHEEVEVYLSHWWRCDGPCQKRRPHFGIVRRSANRAPGPNDYWWNDHRRKCGGTFVKIKEPEKKPTGKKVTANKTKNVPAKPNADISKYITSNIKTINSVPDTNKVCKPVLKDSNTNTAGTKTKSNGSGTIVVSKKGVIFNPTAPPKPVSPFTGNGYTVNNTKHISDSSNVTEHVRNIWASKQIPVLVNKLPNKKLETNNKLKTLGKPASTSKPGKHKAETTIQSPLAKVKKIDDYFKANASSVLKDIYGEDFKLTQTLNSTKLVAVSVKEQLVDCPVCNKQIDSKEINRHLDECLNKEVIEKLSQSNEIVEGNQSNIDEINLKRLVGDIKPIPSFKGKPEMTNNNVVDLTNLNNFFEDDFFDVDTKVVNKEKGKRKTDSPANLQSVDIKTVNSLAKQIHDKDRKLTSRKSADFDTKHRDIDSHKIKPEPGKSDIKSEPGTSKTSETCNQECPCCGQKFNKPVEEHLDECLVFFNNNTTIPEEGASTSFNTSTIFIDDDDDDRFDESQIFNATGTKTPCPCCMVMVEEADMNDHLDICLGLS